MMKKEGLFLIGSLLLFTIGVGIVNQKVMFNFPNSADEYSYYFQAQLIAEGKISSPSPIYPEFFSFIHILNNGNVYSKYPPGWPFLLAAGVLIHAPWIINLLLGILTLLLVYYCARKISGERTAQITLLIMITSPLLILYSASYYSQPLALLLVTLFIALLIKSPVPQYSKGAVIGLLFLVRPYDSVVLFIVYSLFHILKKERAKVREYLTFFLALSLCIGAFLLYNALQTGDPLLTPFSQYDPHDRLGFNIAGGERYVGKSLDWALKHNLFERVMHMVLWIPGSLIVLYFLFIQRKRTTLENFLYALILAFFIAYFFYAVPLFNSFGDRYLYPISSALYLLIGFSLCRMKEALPSFTKKIGVLLVALNLLLLIFSSFFIHQQIEQRTDLYKTVKIKHIENALVFLRSSSPVGYCSGSMSCGDLTRNDPYFNQSVLYIYDRQEKNSELIQAFPERTPYLWKCESITPKKIPLLNIELGTNRNCLLEKVEIISNQAQK